LKPLQQRQRCLVCATKAETRLSVHRAVQRLTHSAQFQAVLGAKTLAKTPHFALHQASLDVAQAARARASARTQTELAPSGASASLWGVVTPKRWAKRAVTRNAIKRQMLAVAGREGHALPNAAYVLRQRAAFDPKRYPSARSEPLQLAVRTELEALMQMAQRA
jgi:ribonuclease P protein component